MTEENSTSNPETPTNPESQESSTPATESTQPTQEPSFGWNTYAERLNGRFAMAGFIGLLLLELITQQDFWTWIGLR
jgi:hypothetical protein